MRIARHLSEIRHHDRPLSVALGVFDGVHLGHQAVIGEAVRSARAEYGDAAIITFHPHPAKVLRPESAPKLLTTEEQDCELFSSLHIDLCVTLDFTVQLSQCAPADFLNDVHEAAPMLHTIVVGPGWHFGNARSGNFALLKSWAQSRQIAAIEVQPVCVEEQVISSTMIRKQIVMGDIASANLRLGRPYQIIGRVVRGQGLGSRLGFPTANIDVENELVPARGVYAAKMSSAGKTYAAAVNIGHRPTVTHSGDLRVEAHLLDFSGDLYGHHVRLHFLQRLREEQTFEGHEALRAQLQNDCEQARNIVGSYP